MMPMSGNRGTNVGPSLPGANGGGEFSTSGFPAQVHFWCTFSGPPIASKISALLSFWIVNYKMSLTLPDGHTPPAHMLEGMKTYLLNVGYPPKATQEIISASNILASYGELHQLSCVNHS